MRFDIRPGVRRLLRFPIRTRATIKRDADEELETLIACRVEHLMARGMSADDARAEAMRRLGASVDQVRHQLHTNADQRERRMRIVDFVESVMQDVRYAARGLARRPAFTAVAVLTLAIGVGATTAIFSALNVLILRPLPYARPDELMKASLVLPAEGGHPTLTVGFAYPTYTALRSLQHSFTIFAAYTAEPVTLTSGDVERIWDEYISASYLRTLGLAPAWGRDFDRALDAHAGAPHEAIISYALWQRRFNADPSTIGRIIDIDRAPWTIIGVGPREFRGLSGQADVFLPVTAIAADLQRPGTSMLSIVARRAPGVTTLRAAEEMSTLGGRLANEFPNRMGKLKWEVSASALDALRLEPLVRQSLLVLFGAACLVLGIAAVNVASLLLGRASARRREIAVRVAMGAGRGRLVRLLLAESLMLALLGGIASIGVAWMGAHFLASVDPIAVFRGMRQSAATIGAVAFSSIALDWHTLGFALATSLVVGLLFGLTPALHSSRASVSDVLKSDRTVTGVSFGRRILVVTQVALALVLLVGSGLMVRSLAKLLSVDVGFDKSNLLTFSVDPVDPIAEEALPGFYSRILDRVRAVPGVADVALDSCVPFAPTCARLPLLQKAGPVPEYDYEKVSGMEVVTPNWFSLMHVRLVRGRAFLPTDRRGGPSVVLLTESAAKMFFGADDPIGKHISLGQQIKDAEVIGIVSDVRQVPDSAPGAITYFPSTQSPQQQMLVFVRTMRDPATIASGLRKAVHEVAPQLALSDMQTMSQREGRATAQNRFRAMLLSAFALAALLLAAIGIYGVLSFAVTVRTRELGIRIALGAEPGNVQRLVIGEGLALVTVGIVLGLAGAFAGARLLRSFLFELTPSDPVTYLAIVVVLGVTAVLASWVPGLRASRVDPVIALRAE
ncbi:MAG TPA: ABC transporter permease [Gemmatimonadaceae bacterium]|jgi:predicted permease